MTSGTGPTRVVLTVAGSDSGGGAGIQADVRTIARLGGFPTTAVTAVTAQNLGAVSAVHVVPPVVVVAQLDAVFAGFPVAAAKTGMLATAAVAEAVARRLTTVTVPLVIDPVMVATSGARLADEGTLAVYHRALFPRATLVTPNLDEASLLLGRPLPREASDAELVTSARALVARLGAAVLLKGGHLRGDPRDVFVARDGFARVFAHARIPEVVPHGCGCTLAAAAATGLAHGVPVVEAVERAISFVHEALRAPHHLGTTAVLGQDRVAPAAGSAVGPSAVREV